MAKQSRQPRFFNSQSKRSKHSPSQKPLPKEPVTLEIERLSHDGRGIAKLNGKTTFVTGALPEETVSARITEQKSKFNAAQTLEIITPSNQRVEPPCPHYQQCGGCELQHLDANTQIEYKQAQALDQLQRIGHISPEQIMPPLDAEPWHYRRRARLSIYCPRANSEPVMGFRRRNDKALFSIQQCPVLLPSIEALIQPLQAWLKDAEHPQAFGHIELLQTDASENPETALVLRHTNELETFDRNALIKLGQAHQCRVYFQSDKSLISTSDETLLNYQITASETPLTLQFSPSDFTQINPAINQQMIQQALDWLQPKADDQILDLFCGLGNFSLPFAQIVKIVKGIEGSEDMVTRATNNAALNQITNASFIKADLNKLYIDEQYTTKQKSNNNAVWQSFNKVLLDPPRAGAQAFAEQLAKAESTQTPEQILYVSCDPATFARDAALLKESGYRLQKWGVINMFPHTTHVESMGLFVQQ